MDKLALWPFRCPSYLRNDHELDCRHSTITRYEGGCILGRLSPRLSRQKQIDGADPRYSGTVGVSRLEDQSRQVRSKTLSEDRIPWNPLEYQGQPHEPPSEEGSENFEPIPEVHLKRTLLPEGTSVPTGTTKFCQFRFLQRATSLPSPSKVLNQFQTTQTTTESTVEGKAPPRVAPLPHATKGIFAKWGKPDVDFFASAGSAVVERYVSRDCSDQHALFTDAFSKPWHCKVGWLFLPPCLIPKVLAHLNKCKGEFLLLATKWDQTF